MSLSKRISARIKLAARIMTVLSKQDNDFPGWRWEGDDTTFKDGYGIEPDNDIPDFVKKDNDGWDYVKRSSKG